MDQEQETPGYVCRECAAEGNPEPQPAANFYWFSSPPRKNAAGRIIVKYKDDRRRSTLCRRHHDSKRNDRIHRQLDPSSPEYNPVARAKHQARATKFQNEVRKKGGVRYKKRNRKPKEKEE